MATLLAVDRLVYYTACHE
ncbi:hypothetical protein SS209_00537 [Salmonella enterica subsp. enterica serovar Senftenberg str. SS209]|nr:hypothetical protein SS209_00537 [Salmonella enterica subsp. enterica serovar Senftenberg str. SS209]